MTYLQQTCPPGLLDCQYECVDRVATNFSATNLHHSLVRRRIKLMCQKTRLVFVGVWQLEYAINLESYFKSTNQIKRKRNKNWIHVKLRTTPSIVEFSNIV